MVEAGSIYLIDKQFWGFYRVDPTMNMTYLLTKERNAQWHRYAINYTCMRNTVHVELIMVEVCDTL